MANGKGNYNCADGGPGKDEKPGVGDRITIRVDGLLLAKINEKRGEIHCDISCVVRLALISFFNQPDSLVDAEKLKMENTKLELVRIVDYAYFIFNKTDSLINNIGGDRDGVTGDLAIFLEYDAWLDVAAELRSLAARISELYLVIQKGGLR